MGYEVFGIRKKLTKLDFIPINSPVDCRYYNDYLARAGSQANFKTNRGNDTRTERAAFDGNLMNRPDSSVRGCDLRLVQNRKPRKHKTRFVRRPVPRHSRGNVAVCTRHEGGAAA